MLDASATIAPLVLATISAMSAQAPPTDAGSAIDRFEGGIAVKEADRRATIRREAFERLRGEALPEPVSEAEIASWAAETGFSSEGLALLPAIDANYRRAIERADADAGRAIRERIEAAYRFDEARERIEPVPTPELVELLEQRIALVEAMRIAEAALFREFDTLADPQRRRTLDDIRHERLQRLYRRPERLPGSTLDLVDLFAKESIDSSEFVGVPELLDRYRRDHAKLLETRHREGLAIELERSADLVDLGPAWELAESPEDAAAIRERLQDLDRRMIELEGPLRAVNRETITSLRRMMPDEEGRRLQRAYQSLTYPEHFRDEDRFVALLALPAVAAALSGDRADAAMLSFDRAAREIQRPALLLMELADGLAAVETLPDPYTRAEASMLLEIRMLELVQQRRDRLSVAVREILNTLPGEATGAMSALREHLAADESMRRASDFRRLRLAEQVVAVRERAQMLLEEADAAAEPTAP
ncbi:MAG: hypothetical protein ACO4CI_08830 [Phycisphaerales bacterium]